MPIGSGLVRSEDVYKLVWVQDVRLAPDARAAAVAVRRVDEEHNRYASAIWLVPLDGSEARQLTSGEKLDMEPRISPDGTRLAFVSDRESDSRQLYVLPLGGGEALKLTDLEEDVTEVSWSPEGTRLTFSSRVRDAEYEEADERRRRPRRFTRLQYKLDNIGWIGDRRRHVFAVAADGSGQATQLTFGDYEDQYPAWSPDGKLIAFASARQEDWDVQLLRDVYTVDAEGGEPERLTAGDAWYEAPNYSPDGALIACRVRLGGFDYPRHTQIAVVDASTGERSILTESLDRNCSPYPEIREPIWESGSILFCIEDRGNDSLYRVAPNGGTPEPVVDGEFRLSAYDAAGGTVVHAAAVATRPAELFAGERRLTEFTRTFTDGCPLSQPERFAAVSPDGSEVDAWLVRPPEFQAGRRYPVLLTIHGGPYTQYGNGFFDEVQVYTRAGYVVLFSNPRGSSGYGEEWGRAIRGPGEGGPGWGSVDYDDLIAVVDTALERFDFCDPERLGVLGGSYGGYMTSWIVSHNDRFKAALSERAVNNLISEFGSSDLGWFERSYTDVWPFEDLQPYIDRSPTTYATNIKTPLLIVHSEQDLRCAIEQGEHLFQILRLLGREVEMVRFPAESHELTRSGAPAHRVQRFEIVLDWFGRYLSPAG